MSINSSDKTNLNQKEVNVYHFCTGPTRKDSLRKSVMDALLQLCTCCRVAVTVLCLFPAVLLVRRSL